MMNAESVENLLDTSSPVICMCRRGNESQRAVVKLKELGCKNVLDIIGGITEMSRIDPTLASY